MPCREFPTIVKLETFIPSAHGSGGDYHRQGGEHWSESTRVYLFPHTYRFLVYSSVYMADPQSSKETSLARCTHTPTGDHLEQSGVSESSVLSLSN